MREYSGCKCVDKRVRVREKRFGNKAITFPSLWTISRISLRAYDGRIFFPSYYLLQYYANVNKNLPLSM